MLKSLLHSFCFKSFDAFIINLLLLIAINEYTGQNVLAPLKGFQFCLLAYSDWHIIYGIIIIDSRRRRKWLKK